MPDVAELGRKVKAKYPQYANIDDAELGRRVRAKYPQYANFTDMPATQQPPGLSTAKNLGLGAEQEVYGSLAPSALSGLEALGSAMTGDFGPAKEIGQSALLGLGQLASRFVAPSGVLTEALQPGIDKIRAEQQARRAGNPVYGAVEKARQEVEQEAAQDPSRRGRITRGVGRLATAAAPAVITGALTGGSVPAMTAVTAAQSLNAPENIPLAAGLGAVPVPLGGAFKAGVNAIRRTFGKGAAQIIEAEARPAAAALERQAVGEVAPVAREIAPAVGEASPSVQRAMQQFEQEVQRIKTLPPAQQAAEMEAAIQRISSEASGVRPVSAESRAGYPPLMEFPENPNAIQQAGILPGEATAANDVGSAIAQAQRTPGAPVYLPQVREQFPGLSKQQFDDEVLKLAEEGQIAIHRNDAPGLMSEAEREGLVKVGKDYFNAATVREGASVRGPSVSAPMDLNATVAQAAKSVPAPKMERFKDELLGLLSLPKSLRSTLDVSYPLRQGAILLLRPFQWRQSAKVIKEMFRSFKTKNFEAINQAIENHPLAERMKAAGVHIDEPGGGALTGEEAFSRPAGSKIAEFVTQKAGKYVGIKQSDQAFTTAGNVQRVEAFQQYANTIDRAGLSAEQAALADKAAAQWVNMTTGRGSLGKRLDKAMEGLNYFFFSPRYVASRLNILNPAMYIKNMSSPGGRVVLKQQMGDLMQFGSMVATTMYLAKQAGADVELNPNSSDFLKIKMGTWRYDPLAGLQQVMRLIYRVGGDINRAAHGEKPTGKTAIDIGETFLNYKLSPPAGVFRDFINQRTLDKKPFTAGRAVADLTAPIQWADFVEAYQKEAWGGVLKASPGALGVGTQNYEQTPVDAAIERAQPLFTELKRLGKQVSDLRKTTKQQFKNGKWVATENEDDASFNKRVQQFGQNYTQYGLQLLDSPRFRQAPDSVKVLALDALNERAKSLTKAEFPFPELALDANTLMDSAEASAAKRNPAGR